jgi:large subunit ribosomal protein L30
VRDTLEMLRLKAVNNCILTPETPDYKGMLEVVKHTVTWGEIERETLVELLKKRLRLKGDKRLDENTLKQITGYGFEELADALLSGKVKMKNFPRLQQNFRLTPPSKGLKNIKEFYPEGDLGYRGKEINELLERMI